MQTSTPTVAIVPDDDLFAKNAGTIEEIRSRMGPVLALTQVDGLTQTAQTEGGPLDTVKIPKSHELLMPLMMLIPLQMIAYYAAIERGCDVDRPRNLAKSVTVE
jgi:glucosamine--fructose-6-phosphate aminotransferase (isomerizing)